MKKIIVIVLFVLLNTIDAFSDPSYEIVDLVFESKIDAMNFDKAYRSNSLEKYFSSISISDSDNLSGCIYQEYFIDNYKKAKGKITLTVADEISYYDKKESKEFLDLLIAWSKKIKLKIIYHQKDHYAEYNPTVIVSGFSFSLSDKSKRIRESLSPSFDCHKIETDIEKIICLSAELSFLDSFLADIYNDLRNHLNKVDFIPIKNSQIEWLSNRNQCKSDKRLYYCLKNSYKRRIEDLVAKSIDLDYKVSIFLITHNNNKISLTRVEEKHKIPEAIIKKIGGGDDWGIKGIERYSLPKECIEFFYSLDQTNYTDELSSTASVRGYTYLIKLCNQ